MGQRESISERHPRLFSSGAEAWMSKIRGGGEGEMAQFKIIWHFVNSPHPSGIIISCKSRHPFPAKFIFLGVEWIREILEQQFSSGAHWCATFHRCVVGVENHWRTHPCSVTLFLGELSVEMNCLSFFPPPTEEPGSVSKGNKIAVENQDSQYVPQGKTHWNLLL